MIFQGHFSYWKPLYTYTSWTYKQTFVNVHKHVTWLVKSINLRNIIPRGPVDPVEPSGPAKPVLPNRPRCPVAPVLPVLPGSPFKPKNIQTIISKQATPLLTMTWDFITVNNKTKVHAKRPNDKKGDKLPVTTAKARIIDNQCNKIALKYLVLSVRKSVQTVKTPERTTTLPWTAMI